MLLRIGMACALLGVALLAGQAAAQVPAPPKTAGTNRQRGLTDQQIRDVLLLRAFQNRGRSSGVKRGVPQFVPYGNQWFRGMSQSPAQQSAGNSADSKRSQSRAARTERLRQTRERTVAKREEAARQRAQARAAARRQPAKANAKAKGPKNDPG